MGLRQAGGMVQLRNGKSPHAHHLPVSLLPVYLVLLAAQDNPAHLIPLRSPPLPPPAEIVAIAVEECFDDLDAPPERVTGAEVPMPYAANLEAAALPQVDHIVSTVKRMMNRQ